jgi:hypothetical protein
MEDIAIENWIPYKLIKEDGQLQCHWLNTCGERFTEPFFDDTILKLRSIHLQHSTLSSVSDLEMMKEWANGLNEVEPTALIFHISRCGSTLVSQFLVTSEENIVLSEVPFFDDLLRLPYKESQVDQVAINELLTAAIKFYGQIRTNPSGSNGVHETQLYIKTDSWHIFFYEQLRRLYPSVPFILMYRSPDEVFRSHKKIPGMQAVCGLIEQQVFGFKPGEMDDKHPDIYLASVLESYLSRYLEIAETDDQFLLLNYSEGPMPMIKKIASFANTALSKEDLVTMEERSRYHSKKPGERFTEETITHIPSCLDKAMQLYHKLEEKRIRLYN